MTVALLDAVADTLASSFAEGGSFAVSAGTNRGLFAITAIEGPGNVVATLSYGGQALTLLVDSNSTGGNGMRLQLWGLNDAGISAAIDNDFIPTGTAVGQTYRSTAFSVTGVLQALTVSDSATVTTSPNGDPLPVDTVVDGMVMTVIATANPVGVTWAGITEEFELLSGMTQSIGFDATPSAASISPIPTTIGSGGSGAASLAAVFAEEPEIIPAWTSGQLIDAAATLSFTPDTGSDRICVVGIHAEGSTDFDIDGATYGGVALPLAVKAISGALTFRSTTAMFTINEAVLASAIGTLIAFTYSGTTAPQEGQAYAATFPDKDQSNPVIDNDTSGSDAGDAAALNVTTVTGSAAVAIFGSGNAGPVIAFTGITRRAGIDGVTAPSSASAVAQDNFEAATPTFTAIPTPSANRSSFAAVVLQPPVPLTLASASAALTFGTTATATPLAVIVNASASAALTTGTIATAAALPEEIGLGLGDRRVFVRKDGNDSNDGLSAGQAKLTIQAGLNIAQPFDVVSIGSGIYFETTFLSGFSGTETAPLWVVAERRGEATISDLWQEAYEGTQVWDDEGGGTFSAVHGDVWSGSHAGDFLFRYQSQSDLEGATLSIPNGLVQNPNVVTKPQYGFAIESGRVFIRLRDGEDPNGKQIKLTDSFSQTIMNFDNCDFVIIDGLQVEGSGDTPAIDFDSSSASPVIRNVKTDHCRGLVRHSSNALVEWCEYTKTGFEDWMVELLTLDGPANLGLFDINKNYNSTSGNTHYEGGLAFGSSSVDTGSEHRLNYIHGVFEGMRAGEHDDIDIHDNVIRGIGDNPIECESFRSSDLSANIRIFHNLIERGHDGYISHQFGSSSSATGPQDIYRNVLIANDPILARPAFLLKMINTDNASGLTDIRYYHNFFQNLRGDNNEASPPDFNGLWADHFSTFDADEITLFANNVAVFEDGMDSGSGPNPQNISDNILAAPSDNATYQGGGGSRVANEAALLLGSNRELLASSPLIGAGGALSGTLPEIVLGANRNDDVGPFPDGFDPGLNWPRVQQTTFDSAIPSAFSTSRTTAVLTFGGTASSEVTKAASAIAAVLFGADPVASSVQVDARAVTAAAFGIDTNDAINLSLSSSTASLILGGAATAGVFSGPRTSAFLSFSGTATAALPPPPVVPILLADSYLGFQRPVLLIDLFFDSATIRIWTRPVVGQFEGNDYNPLAGVETGLTIRNSLDVSSLDAGIQISGQSQELLRIALTENFQRRPALVRVGNLNSAFEIEAIETLLTGTISNMPISDTDEDSTVSIVIDSVFKSLQNPRILRLNEADQALINGDDTFFNFMETTEVTVQPFGGN